MLRRIKNAQRADFSLKNSVLLAQCSSCQRKLLKVGYDPRLCILELAFLLHFLLAERKQVWCQSNIGFSLFLGNCTLRAKGKVEFFPISNYSTPRRQHSQSWLGIGKLGSCLRWQVWPVHPSVTKEGQPG